MCDCPFVIINYFKQHICGISNKYLNRTVTCATVGNRCDYIKEKEYEEILKGEQNE